MKGLSLSPLVKLALCSKIDQVHCRLNFEGRKGFSHQSDHRCLNGRRFIFVNFLKMGTWSVSQNGQDFDVLLE